jgi:sugar phosphate isomerase/epimerase
MIRREFIQKSTFTALNILALPSSLQVLQSRSCIGLQTYTLRDIINDDPKGVLTKVAELGYKEIETFAYNDGKIYNMDFAEFGKFVNGLGMKVTSGHYPLDLIKSDKWERAITDAKSIGQEYMVMPYIHDVDRTSIDDYKRICEILNKAATVANKYEMKFSYHNHEFEFQTLNDQIPYDVMLAELDPNIVSMELDVFWIVNAGKDPFAYFDKYPNRFELWHVKDMDKNDKNKNADVGSGTINWKKLFSKARQAGMKHFFVEQETYTSSPMNSVDAGIKYLKTVL